MPPWFRLIRFASMSRSTVLSRAQAGRLRYHILGGEPVPGSWTTNWVQVAQNLLRLAERAACCEHFRLERSSGLFISCRVHIGCYRLWPVGLCMAPLPFFSPLFYWHLSAVDSMEYGDAANASPRLRLLRRAQHEMLGIGHRPNVWFYAAALHAVADARLRAQANGSSGARAWPRACIRL